MNLCRRRFLAAAAATLLAGCRTKRAPEAPVAGDDLLPPSIPDSSAKRRLLVLGGTGFLGPHIVDAAVARGWEVTLFNRGRTNPHLFPDLEKLRGDRDGNLTALEGRRFEAVMDTSGYVPRIVKASATLLSEHTEQYVFISSVSAYASFKKVGIVEGDPLADLEDPNTEEVLANYGGLKAACERAAEAAVPKRTTVVRPGLIVGPGDPTDRFTYWPVRVSKGGRVLAPGLADDPVQFIDVRDLAGWLVRVMDKKHFGNYNAVGPGEPTTIGGLLETCRDVAKSDAQFVWAPDEFLEQQQVTPWGDMPVWVPPRSEDGRGFARIDGKRALDTGMTHRPVVDTVKDTLAWWEQQHKLRRSRLRAGISPAREAEVLAALASKKAA